MRILPLTFFALLFSFSISLAKPKPQSHSLTFKIYTWFDENKSTKNQKPLDTLYFSRGKKMIPITLNVSEVSKTYKTSAYNHFTLYKKIPHNDKKPTYEIAVTTKISPNIKSAFIYLFHDKDGLKLLPIDTSPQKFPMGCVLFLNNTPTQVGVKTNGHSKLIKPHSSHLFHYKPNKQGTLRIHVKDYNDTTQKNSHTNLAVVTVGARPNQRVIAFFYQLDNGKHRLLLQRQVDDQSIKLPIAP